MRQRLVARLLGWRRLATRPPSVHSSSDSSKQQQKQCTPLEQCYGAEAAWSRRFKNGSGVEFLVCRNGEPVPPVGRKSRWTVQCSYVR